ncbi:antibiotic acetyltransferase [Lacticaseibacillus paracasei subsp. paracasei Lpp46]|nr:antibiotic acetyltransferase [Lacticaseibacillus paracasei subsp. paracasei Lpp46]
MFILNADHRLDTVSSFPFKAKLLQSDKFEGLSKGNILVGDDVWIGYRATILSGVTIGQGAVVAAGAVVADDVAPYSIVGGVPAKTIKFRFRPEMVQTLLNLDFSKLTTEMVRENISSLYQPLTSAEQIKWFPRKKQNEN